MKVLNICLQMAAGIPSCLLCGRTDSLSLKQGLCRICHDRVTGEENTGREVCRRCGIVLLSEKEVCTECRKINDRVRNSSLYPYRGTPKDLVQFYKFQGHKKLALFFSLRIDTSLTTARRKGWTLVPVPPSRGKFFRRGWDQIDLIAKELQKRGWECKKILRDRGGRSQKTLDREERLRESKNRYYVPKGKIVPEKVLILDDVFTTGATIACCTEALLAAGALKVKSLTIARD